MAQATRGASGSVTSLPPLRNTVRVRCPRSWRGFDVGADGLRHPQPVQRQQRHQRVIPWRREPRGDQDDAEFVAVQVGDVGLVVDARPTDVHRRRVIDDFFFFGVTVEPDNGAQPAGDGGAGLAAVLEVASEAFDVHPADIEQPVVVLPAPGGELTQIQGVASWVKPR